MSRVEPISDYRIAAESYVLDDIEYILYRYRVSWDEARIICTSREAHLATFRTEIQMEFIIRAFEKNQDGKFYDSQFSENAASENFWVGARTDSSGSWNWIYNQQRINSDVVSLQIRGTDSEDKRRCLGISLRNRNKPIVLPLPCTAHNKFVCQRRHESLGKGITLVTAVRIGKKQFTLYSARATWPEAVLYCRQDDSQIAEVVTSIEAESLALVMLRTRPEAIENAWIGGYSDDNVWKWLSSGERIPADATLWRKNEDTKLKGCLLLDRHICESPVYVESRCDRKRDILCQRRIQSTVEELAKDKGKGVTADDREETTENYENLENSQSTVKWYENQVEPNDTTEEYDNVKSTHTDGYEIVDKIQNSTDFDVGTTTKLTDDLYQAAKKINGTEEEATVIPTFPSVVKTKDDHTEILNVINSRKHNVSTTVSQPSKIPLIGDEVDDSKEDEDYYEYLNEYRDESIFSSINLPTRKAETRSKNESSVKTVKSDKQKERNENEETIEAYTERTPPKTDMIFRLPSLRPYYAFEGPMKVELTRRTDSKNHLCKWQNSEPINKQSPANFQEAASMNNIIVQSINANCRVSSRMTTKMMRRFQ